MLVETLSTFPHMYDSVMGASMMQRAQDKGLLEFRAHDLRDWTHDRHRTTDDDPYGGGAGLVMKCEPIFEAVEDILGREGREGAQSLKQSSLRCGTRLVSTLPSSPQAGVGEEGRGGVHKASSARREQSCGLFAKAGLSERLDAPVPLPPDGAPTTPTIVFLAPQGRRFDDAYASELAQRDRLLFVCGHYEGIDERVYTLADEVISLGDYVLTSGELASMVVIDAVVRKIPGVLGAEDGPVDESFTSGLLEYPQYTRPASFRGMEVPPVLLSGNHAAVDAWRRETSLERTARLRPDLLEAFERAGNLTPADRKFLKSLAAEQV